MNLTGIRSILQSTNSSALKGLLQKQLAMDMEFHQTWKGHVMPTTVGLALDAFFGISPHQDNIYTQECPNLNPHMLAPKDKFPIGTTGPYRTQAACLTSVDGPNANYSTTRNPADIIPKGTIRSCCTANNKCIDPPIRFLFLRVYP